MNLYWIIAIVLVVALALYLRLPLWFDIPSDPWSPRLETKGYLYRLYPRWLQQLYDINLDWRRSLSFTRYRRRQVSAANGRFYAPYTDWNPRPPR